MQGPLRWRNSSFLGSLKRAMGGQCPRRLIRVIVQCRNRALDTLLHCGSNVRLAIDDARHCFYGDAGEVGNIEYGSFSHYVHISVA